jgi:hypothetical protein
VATCTGGGHSPRFARDNFVGPPRIGIDLHYPCGRVGGTGTKPRAVAGRIEQALRPGSKALPTGICVGMNAGHTMLLESLIPPRALRFSSRPGYPAHHVNGGAASDPTMTAIFCACGRRTRDTRIPPAKW